MIDYKIVTMTEANSLAVAVNELIKIGWEPIGSHTVILRNTNYIYNDVYDPTGGPPQKILMNTFAMVDYSQTKILVKKPPRF